MTRAFLLCRPQDIDIALASAARLVLQGWNAVPLLDESEWGVAPSMPQAWGRYARGQGMRRIECAAGIGEAILANGKGYAMLCKADCDVALTPIGAAWLASGNGTARAFRLPNGNPWGGIWSAPAEVIEQGLEHLAKRKPCGCAESMLWVSTFARIGKLEVSPLPIHEWTGTRLQDSGATLPIQRRIEPNRHAAGMALMRAGPR